MRLKGDVSDDNENNENNDDTNGDINNDASDDANDVDNGPTVLAHVKLARTVCECISFISFHNIYLDTEQRLTPADFAVEIELPSFPELIQRFLYDQLYPGNRLGSSDVSLSACPVFSGTLSLFSSATEFFYAPSDPSGIGGMRHEQIRATDSWWRGAA